MVASVAWFQIIALPQNHYHKSNVQYMLNLIVPPRMTIFFRIIQYLNNSFVVFPTFLRRL